METCAKQHVLWLQVNIRSKRFRILLFTRFFSRFVFDRIQTAQPNNSNQCLTYDTSNLICFQCGSSQMLAQDWILHDLAMWYRHRQDPSFVYNIVVLKPSPLFIDLYEGHSLTRDTTTLFQLETWSCSSFKLLFHSFQYYLNPQFTFYVCVSSGKVEVVHMRPTSRAITSPAK